MLPPTSLPCTLGRLKCCLEPLRQLAQILTVTYRTLTNTPARATALYVRQTQGSQQIGLGGSPEETIAPSPFCQATIPQSRPFPGHDFNHHTQGTSGFRDRKMVIVLFNLAPHRPTIHPPPPCSTFELHPVTFPCICSIELALPNMTTSKLYSAPSPPSVPSSGSLPVGGRLNPDARLHNIGLHHDDAWGRIDALLHILNLHPCPPTYNEQRSAWRGRWPCASQH